MSFLLINIYGISMDKLVQPGATIEVIKKLETARTPANLAATDAGTRWT